jgi:hypothetical protein
MWWDDRRTPASSIGARRWRLDKIGDLVDFQLQPCVQPPYMLYVARQPAHAAHLVYLPGAGLLLQLLHLHISPHPRLSHCDPDDLTRWDSAAGRPRNGCAGMEQRQAGRPMETCSPPPSSPSSLVPFQNSTSALRSPPPPCQSPSREEKKTRRQDRWSITATRGSQVPAVFPHLVAAERATTRTIVDVFPATLSVVGPSLLLPDQVVGIVR